MVYRKDANSSGVDEVAAPRRDLDSKKSFVCTRSGAKADLFRLSGNKFLPKQKLA
ncbi:hypothetical protein [uncultured Helicobacter sp.]|uniref:hypothetical protein n=1 Tax=uncultured Helicobacter sp. TaxID=175537 RepID=UPI003751410A